MAGRQSKKIAVTERISYTLILSNDKINLRTGFGQLIQLSLNRVLIEFNWGSKAFSQIHDTKKVGNYCPKPSAKINPYNPKIEPSIAILEKVITSKEAIFLS